jgi:PAS domain S-box-containing protein
MGQGVDSSEIGSSALTRHERSHPDEQRVTAILEGIGDGFWGLDRQWRLTYFNRAAEAFFGHSRAEVLGRSLWDAFPMLVGSEFERRYRRVMTERTTEEFEAPSRVHPGRWIEVRAFPTPEGLGVAFREITKRRRAEQALVEREAHLAAILNQATAGIAEVDLDGRFLRVNECYSALVGRSPDELVSGMSMQDITSPEDLDSNLRLFRRAIDAGEPFKIEKRYVRPDGMVVWVSNSVSCVRDERGRPRSIVAVAVDLSERRLAEAASRASEALKSSVLEAALDCIITINDGSRIVEWNPAAERTFGYSRNEALGRDLADLIIPPEYRDTHHRGMSRYLSTGEGPVLGKRIELEALRSDGSRFPVELAIDAIRVEGKPYFTAYLRDIAERRQAEAALRGSEERLTATYEHAFVGIAEVDTSGRFLRVNEELSRITGYSREELLASSFADLTHPEDLALDRERFEEQLRGRTGNYILEKRYTHKDGHTLWVELSASMVYDAAGRPLYGVRVTRDISDRKQAARHQRLLIAELNHRVKNTLAMVQAIGSQTLKGADLDPRYREAFEARLGALASAHDLLTKQRWESADIADVVRTAFEPHEGGQQGPFRVSGPSFQIRPKTALALSLALHELATNAVKYGALSTLEGYVEIAWTIEPSEKGERFRLCWSEHGGPPVEAPTRKGFGSRLIERGLAAEFEGGVQLDFQRTGLVCRIDAPLSSILDDGADAGKQP